MLLSGLLLLSVISVQRVSAGNETALFQAALDSPANETEQLATAGLEGSSRRLTDYLLSRHDRNSPPDGIIDLHYELELVHILSIDELRQTLSALVYIDEVSSTEDALCKRWMDPSLAWSPAEHSGINKTWLPMHRVWLPDIIIFNMLHREDLLGSVRAPVVVYSNGTVECSHPAVYTVTCEINIKNFPLDEQKCALEIASWAYSDEKIRMHAHVEHSLQHYVPNEEWQLLNVTVAESRYEHEDIIVSEIHYEVSVRRKPLFYLVTVTFPSYVMCAISVVGLFARVSTKCERQERFSLGVTAILTCAVLSLVVSEKVPHSSTSVPLLVAYFLFNMVIISVAAVATGAVMTVHRMGRAGRQPPRWIMCVALLTPDKELVCAHNNSNNSAQNDTFAERIKRLEERLYGGRDFPMEQRLRREQNGFVRLAERLDWCLMVFFLTLLTLPVLYLFMHTWRSLLDR